jgi:hypothetical protein
LLDVRTKKEFEGKANPDFGTLKMPLICPYRNCDQRSQLWMVSKTKKLLFTVLTVTEVLRLVIFFPKVVLQT